MSNVRDYERGALGPVGQLPAHLVDYYRACEQGWKEWADAMEVEEAPAKR
jgi:hypothetical protein